MEGNTESIESNTFVLKAVHRVMGLTHDGGLGLEPVSSIPGPKSFVQQSQSSELPASLSLHFARRESRRGYWAPPLRDPSGAGGGERGQLQLFYC